MADITERLRGGRDFFCMGTPYPPEEVALHDAAGQAALMAVEALILKLIDKQALSADEAIEAVELCVAAKRQLAEEGKHPQVSRAAARLLSVLTNSLQGARPRFERIADRQSDDNFARDTPDPDPSS